MIYSGGQIQINFLSITSKKNNNLHCQRCRPQLQTKTQPDPAHCRPTTDGEGRTVYEVTRRIVYEVTRRVVYEVTRGVVYEVTRRVVYEGTRGIVYKGTIVAVYEDNRVVVHKDQSPTTFSLKSFHRRRKVAKWVSISVKGIRSFPFI